MSAVSSMLWKTSATSYMRTLLRVVLGLVTFRLLYRSLPAEDFGFWAMLWSVFGFGVLVDFGLGFATQKRVAELSARGEWNELGRVLSTVLVTFCGIGCVVAVAAWFGQDALLSILRVSAENEARYRAVTLVFFAGMALGFPLGIFPEILRGQQRVGTVNLIACIGLVCNFIGILAAVKFGWSLRDLLVVALATTLLPDLICAVIALRSLPNVRIRPSLFCMASAKQTMGFSLVAYLITATNLVLGKTDQLVLGTCLSVASVTIYVAGAKVAEIFSLFTRQIHEALSPAAAKFNATGDRDGLRSLLVDGTRISLIVALPLYVVFAMRLPVLMHLLTGNAISPEAWLTGQIMLAWFVTTIATHSTTKRVFVMTGHERRLLKYGVGEAIANITLSVALVKAWPHPASVAVGSIIPTVLFGWLGLWPWASKEAGMSPVALLAKVVAPGLAIAGVAAASLFISGSLHGAGSAPSLLVFLIESTVAGLIALAVASLILRDELRIFRRRSAPIAST
jgi:O-antigen/teichoic acid export membrane protein